MAGRSNALGLRPREPVSLPVRAPAAAPDVLEIPDAVVDRRLSRYVNGVCAAVVLASVAYNIYYLAALASLPHAS
jgi:hypothetical protein